MRPPRSGSPRRGGLNAAQAREARASAMENGAGRVFTFKLELRKTNRLGSYWDRLPPALEPRETGADDAPAAEVVGAERDGGAAATVPE
jgi:hypothetical protein